MFLRWVLGIKCGGATRVISRLNLLKSSILDAATREFLISPTMQIFYLRHHLENDYK